ncbi:MAG: TRAP transporter small permease [Tissierellia bacterium]|nr:TRAP transporter small permease [Tissierellia bacterium]
MNLIKWLDKNLEKAILSIFLLLMIVVMGAQVVARYVFNSSLSWSEELTRYLFIWSAFLSLPYTIRYGIALKIDQHLNIFSKGVSRAINIIGHILMLFFFLFMFFQSADVVGISFNSGQKSPALGLPMYVVQMSSFIGFGLAIVRVVQSLFMYIREINKI